MKPALIIIDLQKAWHSGDAAASMDAAARYANAALAAFRDKGLRRLGQARRRGGRRRTRRPWLRAHRRPRAPCAWRAPRRQALR